MVLSIIVISHDQKDQLQRCIQSILNQSIPFEYEIIISDDASTDGSWELAQTFSNNYSNIKSYQCNTDDFKPSTRSERSGWNRCNGLRYASGKYIAHVDGDDFFIEGSDIYEKQVKLLEEHLDCSCCMANDYTLREGNDNKCVSLMHPEQFESGTVISAEYYLKYLFRESHCFVYRNNKDVKPEELYGGYYVDTLITNHFIQFGDIVCLNDAGYVYVQYKTSIWAESKRTKDVIIVNPIIYIPVLIPKWRYAYVSTRGRLKLLMKVALLSMSNYRLNSNNEKWISSFDIFIYKTFISKNVVDRFRLLLLCFYCFFLYVTVPKSSFFYNRLYKLLW